MSFPATGWNTLGNEQLGVDKVLTSTTLEALYGNVIAAFQKAPGAPQLANGYVTQAMMAANSVGISQLRTMTGLWESVTTGLYWGQELGRSGWDKYRSDASATPVGGEYVTLAGGLWTLGFSLQATQDNSPGSSNSASVWVEQVHAAIQTGSGSTGQISRVMLCINRDSSSGRAFGHLRHNYIQSSPPYDHGDGVVQGYVYALVNSDGEVTALTVTEDPPWYGNTHYSPREQFVGEDGKVYGRFVKPACCLKDVEEGKATLSDLRKRLGQRIEMVEEVTTETKLRGMDLLPHPFYRHGERVPVLLDPMSDLVRDLLSTAMAGESPIRLFADGYLTIDNTQLKRCGPPGVPVHAAKWKLS